MQPKKISFYSDEGTYLNDFVLKKKIIEYIFKNIDLSNYRFCLLNKLDKLKFLKDNKHYVSPNYVGTSYLLLFLQLKNTKICCIINKKTLKYHIQEIDIKKIEIILLKVNAPEHLWKGSIFNGKISKDNEKNNHVFIIQDIYYLFGNNLLDYEMKKKNEILNKLNLKFLNKECCKNFVFKINEIFEYKDLDYLVKTYMPTLNINYNGLFFQPVKSGIDIVYIENRNKNNENFNDNKSNVVQNNKVDTEKKEIVTVNSYNLICDIEKFLKNRNYSYEKNNKEKDFLLKKNIIPDVYELYDTKTNDKIDIAIIPNIKTSHYCKETIKDNNLYKFSCIWSDKFSGWIPLHEKT